MDDQGRPFLEATMPHLDAIYRVARHASGDHDRAEDLVQETYLRAFAAFDQQRGPSVRAWLVTICLNLARSEGRRRSRRVVEMPIIDSYEPPSPDPAVADVALAKVDRDAVDRALCRLPEDQRVAIVLMDLIGHSASEVATMLGCSRNTVLSRAFRGRQRLMALLVEEGVHHGLS